MTGTIVCGVGETDVTGEASRLAAALAGRLGLRLVLVCAVDGVPPDANESLTARQRRDGAERLLRDLANDAGNGAETRVVVGERADALAQVAAEEGADLIVLGSRASGLGGRKLRCPLSRELEAATPIPVVIAPPATRARSAERLAVAAGAGAR